MVSREALRDKFDTIDALQRGRRNAPQGGDDYLWYLNEELLHINDLYENLDDIGNFLKAAWNNWRRKNNNIPPMQFKSALEAHIAKLEKQFEEQEETRRAEKKRKKTRGGKRKSRRNRRRNKRRTRRRRTRRNRRRR